MIAGGNELLDLVGRIEEAERASGDLNSDVYELLGYDVIRTARPTLRGRGPAWRFKGCGPLGFAERWQCQSNFTGSIDAAMKLMPRGWDSVQAYQPDHQSLCWSVHIRQNANISRVILMGSGGTFALALTAAALRARAMMLSTSYAKDVAA